METSGWRTDVAINEATTARLRGDLGGRTAADRGNYIPGVTDRLPIKMLHDRVLVREPREEGERRSSGGILIPATAQVSKRLIWGEVLAVGNHVRAVETGDRVLFSPEDRFEVEIAGDEYLLLRERDLHAVASERNEANTGLYL
jgi:chaperonin GroES